MADIAKIPDDELIDDRAAFLIDYDAACKLIVLASYDKVNMLIERANGCVRRIRLIEAELTRRGIEFAPSRRPLVERELIPVPDTPL